MHYLIHEKQPRPGYKMVEIRQTDAMPAPGYYYRDMTVDEFLGYALTCHHMTLDAALYQWYVHTQGWEAAQWYAERYIHGGES